MNHRSSAILFLLVLSLAFLSPASATPVEFTREYTYQAGEADSKLTSRAITLEQIKRLLLEELGTYLISRTEVRDSELTRDEIMTYTAGSVATIIIQERWNGAEYFMKAQLKADPDEVARAVLAVRKDQDNAAELEQLRTQTSDSLKEIEQLRAEIERLKKEPPAGSQPARLEKARKEYDQAVAALSVRELLEKGLRLRREGRFQEAVETFSRAIELRPNLPFPYALRSQAYLRLGQKEQAGKDLKQAARLGDPRSAKVLRRQMNEQPPRRIPGKP